MTSSPGDRRARREAQRAESRRAAARSGNAGKRNRGSRAESGARPFRHSDHRGFAYGTLRFEGKTIELPVQAEDALAALVEAEGPLTARALPGPLDDAGRLVLVRRLVREGFLRLVDGD